MREMCVRLSVCQTRELWQNKKTILPKFYTTRKDNHSNFAARQIVGAGRPIVPEILGQTDPLFFENADFQSIFASSTSAVTYSEKKFR